MKIIQIFSFENRKREVRVFGLGDDQQVYEWIWKNGLWEIYKK